MRIVAIDPGNEFSAYCVMDDAGPEYQLLEADKCENGECMSRLLAWLGKTYAPDRVVIERIQSYGMAVGAEVFVTCEWIGRFAQEAEKYVPVEYIYRKDEKLYICGDMRAKDANIRAALIERFAKFDKKNGRGTKKTPDFFYGFRADMWAAAAVAVSYLDMQKEKQLKETRNVKKLSELACADESDA